MFARRQRNGAWPTFNHNNNRMKTFFVWVLPWLVALAVGSLIYLNYYTKPPIKLENEEKETFDWSDVDWLKNTYLKATRERHPIHVFGEPIPPVKDSYLNDPRPTSTLYAAVENVTFDSYGYFIKGGVRYPTQHPWLIPQFEIEEEEEIKHREEQVIALFVPSTFTDIDITLKIMHPLMALPLDIFVNVPIFTNSRSPIINRLLHQMGRTNPASVMEGAVFAQKMYIIDYPEEDGFAYNEYYTYLDLMKNYYSKGNVPGIVLSNEFDTRIQEKEKTLDILTRSDERIKIQGSEPDPIGKQTWYYERPNILSFGTSDIAMAAFMRPNGHLILFTNKLDFIFGARYAHFAGARVTVIVSSNYKVTATKRKAVLDILNWEIPEKEKIHEPDEHEHLPTFDIEGTEHEEELLKKEEALINGKPAEPSGTTVPEAEHKEEEGIIDGHGQKEDIVPEPIDE